MSLQVPIYLGGGGGAGKLLIMFYKGRLHPKGYLFRVLVYERVGFSYIAGCEGIGVGKSLDI